MGCFYVLLIYIIYSRQHKRSVTSTSHSIHAPTTYHTIPQHNITSTNSADNSRASSDGVSRKGRETPECCTRWAPPTGTSPPIAPHGVTLHTPASTRFYQHPHIHPLQHQQTSGLTTALHCCSGQISSL